jgi:hypothetical protein
VWVNRLERRILPCQNAVSDIKIKGIASPANGTFTLKRDHLVYSGSHSATPADLRGFLFSRWWQHFGSKSISKPCETVMAANKVSGDTLPTALSDPGRFNL